MPVLLRELIENSARTLPVEKEKRASFGANADEFALRILAWAIVAVEWQGTKDKRWWWGESGAARLRSSSRERR